MQQYLAIFLGPQSEDIMAKWMAMDEKTRTEKIKAGHDAWSNWMGKYQKSIVFAGGPLGKTMVANKKGISPTKNRMGAFVIVQADSHEAATKMFEGHPHFTIFPGECVEVMPVMPIPQKPQ